jgi:hypothetical protein
MHKCRRHPHSPSSALSKMNLANTLLKDRARQCYAQTQGDRLTDTSQGDRLTDTSMYDRKQTHRHETDSQTQGDRLTDTSEHIRVQPASQAEWANSFRYPFLYALRANFFHYQLPKEAALQISESFRYLSPCHEEIRQP